MGIKLNSHIKSREIDKGTDALLTAILNDEHATRLVTFLTKEYHIQHGFHTCIPLVDCQDHICKQAMALIRKLENSHIVEAT